MSKLMDELMTISQKKKMKSLVDNQNTAAAESFTISLALYNIVPASAP